jgi:hypothetical protein
MSKFRFTRAAVGDGKARPWRMRPKPSAFGWRA